MDIFCKIIAKEIPANVVYEDDKLISIMDAKPFSPGHLLIIPKVHRETLFDLEDDLLVSIQALAKKLITKMMERYPDIVTVKEIVNYGEGQIVKHYHLHLIPFYKDDKAPEFSQEEFMQLLKKDA